MGVLLCLAEHAGESVSKEQLLRAVWPDTFVSDDVLTRSISELRRVFEDDAKNSRFIQTIPKRGYRLVARVAPTNGAHTEGATTAPVNSSSNAWHLPGWIRVAAVAAGVALLLGGLVAWTRTGAGAWLLKTNAPPAIRSLAVLPLQNLSGDSGQEYFADAMTEELITELSRISALKVISRTSIMRYKKTDKSLPEIAHELGVDAIVEGSVLRSGERVRVTAQLIYAPKDANIWVQTYDRDLQDVLALQSTVATAIADEIRVKMNPGEKEQLRSWRPVNLRALEAYLQGRYRLRLEQDNVFKKDKAQAAANEGDEAEKYFRLAIQEDPNYAPPYLGMWEVLVSSPTPGRVWAPKAKLMLLKALQLDDSLAEAHRALGSVLRFDLDFGRAKKEYQRAIQLAPSDPDAHSEYANFLASVEGRTGAAIQEYELAQSLDPKNERMSEAFYFAREFDRSIELFQSQAQSKPADADFHLGLANLYALAGRQNEVISEVQKWADMHEYHAMSQAIGRAYRNGGYKKALLVFAHHLQDSLNTSFFPYAYIAAIYGYGGDKDHAIEWLEKAYQARDLVDSLRDPMWDSLRSDPRFQELVRKVGIPQ